MAGARFSGSTVNVKAVVSFVLGVSLMMGSSIVVYTTQSERELWNPCTWFALGVGMICLGAVCQVHNRLKRLEEALRQQDGQTRSPDPTS